MKKLLSKLVSVVLILVTLWFIGSFAEVIAKNTTPNPQYSQLNLFCLMFDQAT